MRLDQPLQGAGVPGSPLQGQTLVTEGPHPGTRLGVPSKDPPSFQRAPFWRWPFGLFTGNLLQRYTLLQRAPVSIGPSLGLSATGLKNTCTCLCKDTAESQPAYAD